MDKRDFAIVGAGFAGLSAALKLIEANQDVVVIEARDRVGGRVQSLELEAGATIDLGAQWIGPTQDHMYDLVKKFGVEIFPTYEEGNNILYLNKRIKHYRGTIPKIDPLSLINLGWAMRKIDQAATKIDPKAPWQTPNAKKLDSQTLATWMDKNFYSKTAKNLFGIGMGMVLGCDPAEVSLLHALFYVHSGQNLDTLFGLKNGAQQDRFVTGAQSLAKKMAQQIDIKLNSPVRKVIQKKDHIEIISDQYQCCAKRVIIAIAPTLAGRIDYQPPLPGLRDQLTQRVPMASVIKSFAIYEQPFWRQQGLSGLAVNNEGPLYATFDCSPPDG